MRPRLHPAPDVLGVVQQEARGLSEDAEDDPEDYVTQLLVLEEFVGPGGDEHEGGLQEHAPEGPATREVAGHSDEDLVEDG